jgi:hypothetical protein
MDNLIYLREVYSLLTDKQIEAIEAVIEHGSHRNAATVLGKSKSAITQAIKQARRKSATGGYEPESDLIHKTASGFGVTGVSTAYKADGSVGLQWVKQSPDKKLAIETMLNAIENYEWLPAPVILPLGNVCVGG